MSANKYTTAANATVLHTSPLYIILFNALLAKRPAAHEWVVCICLFGESPSVGGT